ncbi:hypothetical protein MX715_002671 [Vibrio parahaemolyticus]|uniref:hypothetical protein n=1 Tax=Vibrio parahaemolyticus TaxID=670 RepID=UPI0006A5D11C|nr:hypothetical protein [Vibrio parahaemolyticus]EGQ8945852.1 hypothetical protein [Vibrio parahaemolyticus]EGR3004261.1 hypothetical protein [Vibrio parahaemolyticus]EGR3143079.1 hypothetical protein [Vibrio parahaemolyticus]EGR3181255.1 hypothetical protein [Vibrio parahaemolyticus]EGR3195835.1 hypothetical protein [Vibrio parahaemolyticus]
MDSTFVNWFLIPSLSVFVPFWIMHIRKSERRKWFIQIIVIPIAMIVSTILYMVAGYYYFLGPELAFELFDNKYLFLLLVFMTSVWSLQKIVAYCIEVLFDLRDSDA